MASRTKDRLIEVARQLFMRKGLDNTTMNDIATASDRGRRTLYTYFSTKSDIFQAVVEKESATIRAELDAAIAAAPTPADKLRTLIEMRLSLVTRNAKGYQVWLDSLMGHDKERAEAVRTLVSDRIYEMIDELVEAGIASGNFIPEQARRLPAILTVAVRGSDWILANQSLPEEQMERWQQDCIDFITNGITKTNQQ